MHRIGFDSDQYVEMQSRHIAQRRSEFGGKLYLEFGGKLIDDMHASRVLPGFTPDNKVRMLRELADEVEIIVAVNAKDFARRKVRADMGTTYDDEVLRQIDEFRERGLFVGSVVTPSGQTTTRRPPRSRNALRSSASASTVISRSPATPRTWSASSRTRVTARTNTFRPAVTSWL